MNAETPLIPLPVFIRNLASAIDHAPAAEGRAPEVEGEWRGHCVVLRKHARRYEVIWSWRGNSVRLIRTYPEQALFVASKAIKAFTDPSQPQETESCPD